MEEFSKPKRRTVTYGKAARKQNFGRPVHLDSDDEKLPSISKQINERFPKAAVQATAKVTSKPNSASKLSTPPMSPSPSITSPTSSTGTKRTSPFLDEPTEEQKKRVRRTRRASSSSLEDMFSVVKGKTRKPVPKLGSKRAREPVWSTSDDTQILLDNQLKEPTPPPPPPSSAATAKPATMKKASALRMPTRVRPSGPAKPTDIKEIQPVVHSARSPSRSDRQVKQPSHSVTAKVPAKSVASTPRPKTPDKALFKPSAMSIISPSAIELDTLKISSNRNSRPKTPEPNLLAPITQTSPKPSPSRVKLKDRMTSDLNDMMMDVDSSVNDISSYSPARTTKRLLPVVSKRGHTDEFTNLQPSSSQMNVQSTPLQGPKVTYGAARWTFLPDEDEEMALLDPILDSQESYGQSNKTRQLPELSIPVSNVADFDISSDDENDGSATAMRSLHELKRAGGSQRVNRQIDGLLDDIEQSSTKSQRIGALTELVLRLKQSSFMQQFLDSGAESRLLAQMEPIKDTVARILYCTAFLLILDRPNLSMMSIGVETVKLSQLCGKLLDQKVEIGAVLKARNNNLSKDSQKTIEKLFSSLRTLPIWSSYKPSSLTPQTIGLACLERLVRKSRECGNRDELLSTSILVALIDNLTVWGPDMDSDTMLTVWMSLSTLESASLVFSLSQETIEALSWGRGPVVRLMHFSTNLLETASITNHGDLLSLVLRLCLNISNGSSKTCSIFCNIKFIRSVLHISTGLFGEVSSAEIANKDLMLDNLVLSLGLLINLSEKTAEARDLFLVGDSADESPLQALLQVFKSRLQEAFEVTSEIEIRSNVPFGYLAVLLGYLCKSQANFNHVRDRLEGGNLRLLLIAIGEFLQYHQKVEELKSADMETEVKNSFISRLQVLMDELRAKDGMFPPGQTAAVQKRS